jgi:general secretion pathway protein M
MSIGLAKLRSSWRRLSGREQQLIGVLIVIALCLVVYLGLWKPLDNRAKTHKQMLILEQERLEVVIKQANQIESMRQKNGSEGVVAQPLNQVIATSSSTLGISLIRLQPKNEQLQVWIEPLSFDRLVDWLDMLERQYGVQVTALDIERAESSGMVEIRRLEFR